VFAPLEDRSPSENEEPVKTLVQFAFSNASLLRIIKFETVVVHRAID
jgi:hypothetical protein